ncbi:MAG: CDP-glycerol glycerophosphotransferase family protein, partial [Allobaculum sp.]|nr:CDP-glycerol glycerophosphotransferase family protein [Allobaculum sp.]
ARIEYAIKHYPAVQWLYRFSMSSAFRLLGLFVRQDPNLVLYNSMIGRSNYDSPKAIFDYLISNSRYSHLKHVWAFNEPEKVEGYEKAERIRMDSFAYFKTALKAGYWITNVNIERGLKFKKRGTRYLNTWHGVAFNHIGNDVPGRNDYDSRNVDVVCYESDYSKEVLKRALRANDDSMIPSGLPRNDELYSVDDNIVCKLKVKLGLPLDKKIILYAPTWRDSEDMGKDYSLAPPIDFKRWKRELGDEYIVLLRTHHLTTKLMNVKFDDFVIDMTSYPRINDLFKVSDILISDYSACIADFSILERPIICFAYDYDTYKSARGLYIDFEREMPNGIFRDETSVINHIKSMDIGEEKRLTKRLKEKFTNFGGNATEMCVNYLFNKKK